MGKLYNDYFKYKDNFKTTEAISSIAIFEANLNFTPKFTIAIPTYKRADLLKEAVDSALNQNDFTDYDVIVVDNNPERNCETELLMKSYSNIRLSYYKNAENLGMCGNWNRLYTLAKGEWVVMLHDDDLLLPNYLDEMEIYTNTLINFSAIFPSYVFFNNTPNIKEKYSKSANKTCEIWHIHEKDFLYSNMIGNPIGLCFKKQDLISIGGFNSEFYPSLDLDLFIKASHYLKICKFPNNEPICLYRLSVNEGSKIELILSAVKKDYEMKLALIDNYIYTLQYIWKVYFKVFGCYQFENACSVFNKENINLKKELHTIGFETNFISLFTYKIIKQFRKKIFKRSKNHFFINV